MSGFDHISILNISIFVDMHKYIFSFENKSSIYKYISNDNTHYIDTNYNEFI